MKIYIDQSGRVEYTGHSTVVAYANDKSRAIFISSVEKRKIQNIFRQAGKPNMFAYKTFATLIYLVIKADLHKISAIIIDKEYAGREDLVKKLLIELIRRGGDDFDPKNIHFDLIGKKNQAHKKAISVFRGREKPDIIVTKKELLEWII